MKKFTKSIVLIGGMSFSITLLAQSSPGSLQPYNCAPAVAAINAAQVAHQTAIAQPAATAPTTATGTASSTQLFGAIQDIGNFNCAAQVTSLFTAFSAQLLLFAAPASQGSGIAINPNWFHAYLSSLVGQFASQACADLKGPLNPMLIEQVRMLGSMGSPYGSPITVTPHY